MKVKLYELLRMLCEDELVDKERIVCGNYLCIVNTERKALYHAASGNIADNILYYDKLSTECELIDRK